MPLPLTSAQLNSINSFGATGQYPQMYNFIAGEMRAGRIAGATQDQIYWFEQAAKINAGDTSSPASVFIRAATVAGLQASGSPADATHIQNISNGIAQKVFEDIISNQAVPDFKQQLQRDIGVAIQSGGMTIGGWGGAFYYWNESYVDPLTNRTTTVGDAIISNPSERSKFIAIMTAGTEAAIDQFGVSGLVSDPAFFPALGGGIKNIALSAPLFAAQLVTELHDDLLKYGAEAVRQFETELLKLSGWKVSMLDGQEELLDAEYALVALNDGGELGESLYDDFTSWSADLLLGSAAGGAIDANFDFSLDPIGAFYDSQSTAHDNAGSIAGRTPVLINANLQAVTAGQVTTLDVNSDGKVSVSEASSLRFWRDLDENGQAGPGEIGAVDQAITTSNWSLFTNGNQMLGIGLLPEPNVPAGMETQSVPDSNYRTLRDTDNIYVVSPNNFIVFDSSQIKINHSNRSYLIGTDTADIFDSSYYASQPQYFDVNLLINFLAGGGSDLMGGSIRGDNLWGGTGDDTLMGYEGDDRVYGEEGADELQGGVGQDILLGADGNDKLFGQVGNDSLWGGAGADILVGFTMTNESKQGLNPGETDDDLVLGEAGSDNILGKLGNDLLDGGADNDLILGGQGEDTLKGGSGKDELQGNEGHDQLGGDADDDKLFGQAGNDVLFGGDGNDILMGFRGSNESQLLAAGETDDDTLYGGAGTDMLIAGIGADHAYGGDGRDELQGGDGADMLYGEQDEDHLFGQVGDDVLYGGEGDDYLQGFNGSNEWQQFLINSQTDNDKLYGGAGRDTLAGGLGDDYLDGGADADIMVGGFGADTFVVNSVNDVICEEVNGGNDIVIASTNYLLNANIEELRLLEGFTIHGTGNAGNNRIVGNSAGNILDGVTGADTMIGSGGDDTYYVDSAADVVTEAANEGADVVQSSISYTLGSELENLVLLDFSKPERGLVDGEQVLVFGYPKRNELDYMQGDAVENFLGTCALTAISNLLTQSGQTSSESQVVTLAINNNWTVTDPSLPAYLLGGSNVQNQQAILDSYGVRNDVVTGYDEDGIANLVRSGRGLVIAVNAGKLWGEVAYIGSGQANHAITLTGAVYSQDEGNLLGFYIADSGRGLVSDMTRFVSIETFRAAADVPGGYAIYTLEPVKYWQEDIAGTGNAQANTLVGNRGNNLLTGLEGNDLLEGDAGADTLDGSSGVDTMAGGAGDDIFIVDSANDVVTESVGDGVDGVLSTVNYALGANLENLTLTGSVAMSGTGNSLANVLNGNGLSNSLSAGDGDDTLDGGAGNDTMTGGVGNDLYYVNTPADSVVENASGGNDSIFSSVTLVLAGAGNIENLILTGAANLAGTGNALDNRITGNSSANTLVGAAGNDTLDGGVGADSMDGGAGNDSFFVDQAGDSVKESSSGGIDTVFSHINYTLGSSIENLTLLGFAATNGTGNGLNNELIGNSASNSLIGSTGNDTLDGGAGNDVLNGGAGNDTYRFGMGAGNEQLLDSGGTDTLSFGTLASSSVSASRVAGEVVLTLNGADKVRFADLGGGSYAIEQFVFSDGTQSTGWLTGLLSGNRPPSGTDSTAAGTEDSPCTITVANFGFTDSDAGDSLGGVRIDVVPAVGNLKLNGVNVTAGQLIAVADISAGKLVFSPAPNGNGAGYANFGFSVRDQSGAFDALPNTLTFNVAAINDAPVGTVSISGTPERGKVLTAATGTLSDADGVGVLAYQWLRGTSPIPGATGSTYTLVQTDVGSTIRVEVRYTDGGGTLERVTSIASATVTEPNNPCAGDVTISGSAIQFQTLTAVTAGLSDLDGLGTFAYQWFREGVSISGATAKTYTLTQLDVTKTITVRVAYVDGRGFSEGKTSPATGQVANVNELPTGGVSIGGSIVPGQTIWASTGSVFDPDGMNSFNFTYQWMRGTTPISGATASSYTLATDDDNKDIKVIVKFTDAQGTQETLTSGTVHVGQRFTGGAGNDTLTGGAYGDLITGNDGDDFLTGNGSRDIIHGGNGIDTINYNVPRSNAATMIIDPATRNIQVSEGGAQSDSGIGVERVKFTDMALALDLNGNAGMAARVTGALLGENYIDDRIVMGLVLDHADLPGMTQENLAAAVAASSLFGTLAGSFGNADFVTLVINNVLHRDPTTEELALYVGQLDNGEQSKGSLGSAAASMAENLANINFDDLQWTGFTYQW